MPTHPPGGKREANVKGTYCPTQVWVFEDRSWVPLDPYDLSWDLASQVTVVVSQVILWGR